MLWVAVLLTAFVSCQKAPVACSQADRFVDSLMREMTFEEKLGQLNLPVTGNIVTGQAKSSNIAEDIRKGRVGGLFNLKGVEAIKEVQRIAVEESRLHIPLLFGMDVIHGYETVFPIPLAMAASWDTAATETMARISALESTADGIAWTFSPMVDICCDARWGRIAEGFGEDPYLASVMSQAMVRGYQGNDLSDSTTMMACVKHFALYGAPEGALEYYNVELSRYRMYNDYFPPYKAAIDAGVESVMASFNTVEGVPATCNSWLLNDILREQWGFKGMVVSDYTAVQELRTHGYAADKKEAAELSIKAGLDMDMVSEAMFLLDADKTYMPLINRACKRVLMAKYKLGLFDDPYRYCNTGRRQTDIFTAENRALARQAARETFVLLKNDNNLLPLKKTATIALIGPLADTRANMSGTWAVSAVHENNKTLKEGLQDAVRGKGRVLYAKGCNLVYDAQYEANATMFGREMRDSRSVRQMQDEAMQIARQADVIVCAMGEAAEMSGECASRTDLTMLDAQRDMLQKLLTLNKPIVLLNFSGRPVVLNWENEHLDAILQVWFAGSETGDAVADVLFGNYSPSGKLPVAFPRATGQLPMTYRRYSSGRPLAEGKDTFSKFQSSYIDCPTTPLYPFGYGLTYSEFAYSEPVLSGDVMSENGELVLSVDVTNIGRRDADEVVQLYVRALVSKPVRPVKELKAFKREHFKVGETKRISFIITPQMLGFYNAEGQFELQRGEYQLMVGPNSRDLKKVRMTR